MENKNQIGISEIIMKLADDFARELDKNGLTIQDMPEGEEKEKAEKIANILMGNIIFEIKEVD